MRSGKPHGTVTGQKTVRTVAIHLAIITIGFFLISAALRVRLTSGFICTWSASVSPVMPGKHGEKRAANGLTRK